MLHAFPQIKTTTFIKYFFLKQNTDQKQATRIIIYHEHLKFEVLVVKQETCVCLSNLMV